MVLVGWVWETLGRHRITRTHRGERAGRCELKWRWHAHIGIDIYALARGNIFDVNHFESRQMALEQRLGLHKLALNALRVTSRCERLPVTILLLTWSPRICTRSTSWIL